MLLKLSLNLTLRSPQLTHGARRRGELFGRGQPRQHGGLGLLIDGVAARGRPAVVTAAGPGGQPGRVLAERGLLRSRTGASSGQPLGQGLHLMAER